MARKRYENNFHSVGPVRFNTDSEGDLTGGWSQTIRRMVPEQSPHWEERKKGDFAREQVYPCNEGFPAVIRIGPTEGGWPMTFEVILSTGLRSRGIVDPLEQVDGLPRWLVEDEHNNWTTSVSYYDVAGWATPGDDSDYRGLERFILWLARHWPIGR